MVKYRGVPDVCNLNFADRRKLNSDQKRYNGLSFRMFLSVFGSAKGCRERRAWMQR